METRCEGTEVTNPPEPVRLKRLAECGVCFLFLAFLKFSPLKNSVSLTIIFCQDDQPSIPLFAQ